MRKKIFCCKHRSPISHINIIRFLRSLILFDNVYVSMEFKASPKDIALLVTSGWSVEKLPAVARK